MYVTYNNLFKLLIDKGLNKTEFAREVGISSNTLAKLSKNELVSLEVLVRTEKTSRIMVRRKMRFRLSTITVASFSIKLEPVSLDSLLMV